ncbi:uncharacterized protein LOC124363812 [Homalodisca vitripennis]|uniref:uncharacterized protein LOC124363812 n=1 Tax=Homalodisca vitripennis TaxID=197043 RepID=UPI001EEA7C38|nr:uncharacterized protein LOC124363812 [Homalodisca vitripennis]
MAFPITVISVTITKQYRPISFLNVFTHKIKQYSTTKVEYNKNESVVIPKNILADEVTTEKPTSFGLIYDTKPSKVLLKAKKRYNWCCCGQSKNQPFCDGTHMNPFKRISLRPVKFMVEEEKEYLLCNCKQTAHRPFCDGTHKREDIQKHVKS